MAVRPVQRGALRIAQMIARHLLCALDEDYEEAQQTDNVTYGGWAGGARMSQRSVESLLGRLITDKAFRRVFYEDPASICVRHAIDLTTRELEAILSLDESRLAAFAKQLDARIIRAAVSGPHYWGRWPESATASHAEEPLLAAAAPPRAVKRKK
jgi:hypothetical protein